MRAIVSLAGMRKEAGEPGIREGNDVSSPEQGNPGRLAPAGVLRPSRWEDRPLPLRLPAAGLLAGRLLRSRLLAAALLATALLLSSCHTWVSPLLGGPVFPGTCHRLSDPRGNGLEGNHACSSVFLHAHRGTRATVAANRNTAISASSRRNAKKNNRMEELVADTRTRTARNAVRACSGAQRRARVWSRNWLIAKGEAARAPRAGGASACACGGRASRACASCACASSCAAS